MPCTSSKSLPASPGLRLDSPPPFCTVVVGVPPLSAIQLTTLRRKTASPSAEHRVNIMI
ncbi:unnamed protein product [Ixodes pacificus]